MKLEKGLIHIYTGDGKGKTTAALGQGIRAAGNGLKVYMVQFLKTSLTGELETIKKIDNFYVFRFETPKNFFWNLTAKEKTKLKEETNEAISFINKTIETNDCDVLILDEFFGSLSNSLIDKEEFMKILNKKPINMEIIMTGRNAPIEFIELSDYVSEIKMIKHPYQKGINSRKGIEY